MLVRTEWQIHRTRPTLQTARRPQPRLDGWLLISSLSTLFGLWLGYHWLLRPFWLSQLPPILTEMLGLLEAAGGFTLAFLWISLLWRRWHRPTSPSFIADLAELQEMEPARFEQYVAQLFRQKGYGVILRGRKGDLGVDLELIRPDGKRAIVQCKRYHNTVGPKIVRELYGTLIHERVPHAFLVTTAVISDAAREWAKFKPMTLIDGETLVKIAAALNDADSQRNRP